MTLTRFLAQGGAFIALVTAATSCSSSTNNGSASRAGSVRVQVALFGGPLKSNGEMALSNRPAQNANVTVVDASGHKRSATTDHAGSAAFVLAPGRYAVYSTYCGARRHSVTVAANTATRVRIHCDVP